MPKKKTKPSSNQNADAIKAESDSGAGLESHFQRLTLEHPGASQKANRLVERWNEYFKKGELTDYQRLCKDLGLDENLPSKTQCCKALEKVRVNIVQFLGAQKKPDDVVFFENLAALRAYTLKKRKIFPKANIPKGSPLRTLLKVLTRRNHA